ncbi:hypothetical protein HYV50_05315 [Candidatus Pacearchaeota archaeon]|nr:hypothetical protein [Candidatus Pacearchaeota archaeon]
MSNLSWKIWLFSIVLGLSLVSIMSAQPVSKLFAFTLIVGLIAALSFLTSKGGKILVALLFIVALGIILYSSIEKGVLVKSVDTDSQIFKAGLKQGEIITEINGEIIKDKQSYASALEKIFKGFNETTEKKLEVKTNLDDYVFLTNETLQITIDDIPKTKIQTGLDLRGGARALVKPTSQISDSELDDLVAISRNRFNVYGLSDVNIKGVSDLSRNKFMLIEVAGSTPNDLEELILEQGKFEAKIGNITVFEGGEKDISDVCRNDASCAAVTGCQPSQGQYICQFSFAVYLRENAAQKHADITRNISLDQTGQYLNESLYLYVDEKEVDTLLISSNLRGQVTTQISIQGSGTGATQDEAIKNARLNMNRLQTILLTGSLPYKLEIVKLDTISPTLGQNFIYIILLTAVSAVVAVSLIIFIRYRKIKTSLALLLTSFSELFIILGVASLIKWNLDLPSIAGILATIGTGVDQQIIILDETGSRQLSLKERIKRASAIILTAYLTLVAAMIPLYWAGAGLFKGFALTTIIGITAGILITRPAFAEMIRRMESQ